MFQNYRYDNITNEAVIVVHDFLNNLNSAQCSLICVVGSEQYKLL